MADGLQMPRVTMAAAAACLGGSAPDGGHRQTVIVGSVSTERSHVVTREGLAIRVVEWPGTLPTVIALHGKAGCAQERASVAATLKNRVLAIDLRGHGASDWATSYTLDDHVADVIEVSKVLNAGPSVVAGHSLGGLVTIAIPAGALDLRGRVVLDIGPELPLSAVAALRASASKPEKFTTVNEAVARLAASDPFADMDALERRVLHSTSVVDGAVVWRHDPAAERPAGDPFGGLWSAWTDDTLPALLMRGEHSPYLPAELADRMTTSRPGTLHVGVPDAGHDVLADAATLVAETMNVWLAALAQRY